MANRRGDSIHDPLVLDPPLPRARAAREAQRAPPSIPANPDVVIVLDAPELIDLTVDDVEPSFTARRQSPLARSPAAPSTSRRPARSPARPLPAGGKIVSPKVTQSVAAAVGATTDKGSEAPNKPVEDTSEPKVPQKSDTGPSQAKLPIRASPVRPRPVNHVPRVRSPIHVSERDGRKDDAATAETGVQDRAAQGPALSAPNPGIPTFPVVQPTDSLPDGEPEPGHVSDAIHITKTTQPTVTTGAWQHPGSPRPTKRTSPPKRDRVVAGAAQESSKSVESIVSDNHHSPGNSSSLAQPSEVLSQDARSFLAPPNLPSYPGNPKRATPGPAALSIETEDVQTSSAMVECCLRKHLTDMYEVHAVAVKHLLRRQRRALGRDFKSKNRPATLTPYAAPITQDGSSKISSPFDGMKAIQIPTDSYTGKERTLNITHEINFNVKGRKQTPKPYLSIPGVGPPYTHTAIKVPYFHEYTTLKDNILVLNEPKLLHYPFFADEDMARLKEPDWEDIENNHKLDIEGQGLSNLHTEKSRMYFRHVEDFLKEIGVTWESIIFWLLAPADDIKAMSKASGGSTTFDVILLDREPHRDFVPGAENWILFLATLPKPTVSSLKLSALACAAFLKQCNFQIWHVARRSQCMQEYFQGRLEAYTSIKENMRFQFRTYACRICHQHHCLSHGGMGETAILSKEDADTTDTGSDSNSDFENLINYKRSVTNVPHAIPDDRPDRGSAYPRDEKNWNKMEIRRPFYPCSHDGLCEEVKCSCAKAKVPCEKSCGCSVSCSRRWKGCTCNKDSKTGCTVLRPPTDDNKKKCECLILNRECDPDLCGSCGAEQVLDPMNRYNDGIKKDRCTNVAIQLSISKKTFLGNPSCMGLGYT
ncbi:hypothetical protein BCR34DRAFT_633157 [Clohesyomyces aquaticus]|uniref:CXC domain-containing protein n=1 Tax=Clohesyomyces aquaticus TaxID=1231657 RepID=A0A1Y1Z4V5_9PLEO|nr:hypothetical protein BCR34DRAFT_633157 [Clohesyomyces aquaticus]